MLEILFVILIYKKLKKRLEDRNQNKGLAWLGPVCWIGGEIFGGFIAGLIFAVLGIPPEGNLAVYGIALLCGALATTILFIVVFQLPPRTLSCPKCGLSFKGTAKFGVTCESCDTRLKIVDGRVVPLETA